MGEHQRKRETLKGLLNTEPRCIYCANPATSIEHMPPISMFKDKQRLRGMEFASCRDCNEGTKVADMMAVFVAHANPFSTSGDWRTEKMKEILDSIERFCPGFKDEFDRGAQRSKSAWIRDAKNLLRPVRKISLNGPILNNQLRIFSAKLGMALYREHTGHALPLNGGVGSAHFLNVGLNAKQVDAMLHIMPGGGELKMGKRSSRTQFAYRYNTDERSIVAALAGFHGNFHCLVIATSDLNTYGPALQGSGYPMHLTRPGELTRTRCV